MRNRDAARSVVDTGIPETHNMGGKAQIHPVQSYKQTVFLHKTRNLEFLLNESDVS